MVFLLNLWEFRLDIELMFDFSPVGAHPTLSHKPDRNRGYRV